MSRMAFPEKAQQLKTLNNIVNAGVSCLNENASTLDQYVCPNDPICGIEVYTSLPRNRWKAETVSAPKLR